VKLYQNVLTYNCVRLVNIVCSLILLILNICIYTQLYIYETIPTVVIYDIVRIRVT